MLQIRSQSFIFGNLKNKISGFLVDGELTSVTSDDSENRLPDLNLVQGYVKNQHDRLTWMTAKKRK